MSYPVTFTQSALNRIKSILADYFAETGLEAYLQVSIVQKGCSGLSYDMQIINSVDPKDITAEDVRFTIKANSLLWLMGSEIDYQVKDTSSGFVFTNPNEKRNCHCGAAFYV